MLVGSDGQLFAVRTVLKWIAQEARTAEGATTSLVASADLGKIVLRGESLGMLELRFLDIDEWRKAMEWWVMLDWNDTSFTVGPASNQRGRSLRVADIIQG